MASGRACPRVMMTFAPAWWHAHYGMDFGRRTWLDPIRRTELGREQSRLLFERFGKVGLGEKDPQANPVVNAYGDRFMAALWGCEIVYQRDQAPAALVVANASERLRTATMPDIEASPVVRRAFEDARRLEERYGRCDASINFGGALNNAVTVFGEAILAACLADDRGMLLGCRAYVKSNSKK